MEALSGGASAFAIVSLSVQLLENISRLWDFWERVRGAETAAPFIAALHDGHLRQTVVKQQPSHSLFPVPLLHAKASSCVCKVGDNLTNTDRLRVCCFDAQLMDPARQYNYTVWV